MKNRIVILGILLVFLLMGCTAKIDGSAQTTATTQVTEAIETTEIVETLIVETTEDTSVTEEVPNTEPIETVETMETIEATEVIETTEFVASAEATEEASASFPTEKEELDNFVTQPSSPTIDSNGIEWYSEERTSPYGWITTTSGGSEFDRDFLAKLLYAEAGIMGWTGQVYVCSAILNLCDRQNVSIWEAGHTKWMFAVSEIVDKQVPTQMQYDVIDYVLNGGRVMGVCFFRTNYYHNFGTPMCRIENVYFSY